MVFWKSLKEWMSNMFKNSEDLGSSEVLIFEQNIFSPVEGNLKNLEDLNDDFFSEKIIGDGIAIEPTSDLIFSPVDGEIHTIYPNQNAFSILTSDKTNVLIHIGLKTSNLENDNIFTTYVEKGQKISKGDMIAKVDFDKLKKMEFSTEVIVLITHDSSKQIEFFLNRKKVDNSSIIIRVN